MHIMHIMHILVAKGGLKIKFSLLRTNFQHISIHTSLLGENFLKESNLWTNLKSLEQVLYSTSSKHCDNLSYIIRRQRY